MTGFTCIDDGELAALRKRAETCDCDFCEAHGRSKYVASLLEQVARQQREAIVEAIRKERDLDEERYGCCDPHWNGYSNAADIACETPLVALPIPHAGSPEVTT